MSTEVNHAKEQAIAKVESIKEMMDRLDHIAEIPNWDDCHMCGPIEAEEYHDADKAREAIDESPLSVEVRTGWYSPGAQGREDLCPAEYCLLLCTGGPAVRIMGTLGNYSEPETARIEYQDWGTPWTEMRYGDFNEYPGGTAWNNAKADKYLEDAMAFDALLLSYARQFWYGE